MEKVYLILRDNRQTGPFTIGELLQQQLRPTDMIWIEGRSTAWAYLSEMELKPSMEMTSTKEKKSRVITEPAQRPSTCPTPVIPENNKPKRRSSPPDEIEKKAEELRKQALTAGPQFSSLHPPINLEDYQSRIPVPVEEQIDFVDHREQKKLPVLEIVSGVLVTAFVAACIIGGRTLIDQQPAPVTIVAAKEVSTVEHQAKAPVAVASALTIASNDLTAGASTTIVDSTTMIDSTAIVKKPKTKTSKSVISGLQASLSSIAESTIDPLPSVKDKEEKESTPVIIPEIEPVSKKSPEIEKKEVIQQTPKENEEAQTEEKKKGLFRKIFGKKKNQD